MKNFLPIKLLLVTACLVLGLNASYAQFTATGTVSSPDGSPLVGASVLVKGLVIGDFTDDNGSFSIDVPENEATLFISYVGYRSQEIAVSAGGGRASVTMEEEVTNLDEVVITGLASSVKRANLANAVATVSAEELADKTTQQSLDNALFGKISGVQMSANSGAPGGGVNVQLRGISTLGAGSSQPLYIIDGVYVDNSVIRTGRTQVNGASGGANASTQDDATNRIADLNPDEIEKIEVLKGPSAAAIYGTRANAGVIVITTKRGKAGKTKVNFTQDLGVAQGQNFQDFGIWDRQRVVDYTNNSSGQLAQFEAAEAEGRNTDWEEYFYGRDAFLSNSQLSISGGNARTQFYLSGGLQSEEGIIERTGFDRYSVRANVDHLLGDRIKVSLNTGYYRTDSDRGFTGNQNNTGGSIGYALALTPSYADLFPDDQGNYPNNPFFNDNPIAIRDLGENNQVVDRFITAGAVDFDIFENDFSSLKLKVNGGVDYLSSNTLVYFPEVLQHQQAQANPGDVMWGRQDNLNTNIQGFLNYNANLGKITSNTTLGVVRLDQSSEFLLSRGRGLSGGQTNLRWAAVQSIQSQINTDVTDIGLVAQEDINFNDQIIASVGIRFDRSTLNGDQDKFYAFPKASLAANLHNFGNWNTSLVNQLKVRAAYGETGGLPLFGRTFESLTSQLIGGRLGGQVSTRGVDPNLEPETAQEIEVGVDAAFLDNRITVEATYYNKQVKDLILDRQTPESTGITAIATNAGDLTNEGFELGLGINSVRSENLSIFTKLLYWQNRSEITRLDIPAQTIGGFGNSLGTYLFAEGFSPTTIVGNPSGTDNPLGLSVFGDRQPDFTMSLYNEITLYKNLDITFLFHWQNGGEAINLSAFLWDIGGTTPNWNGDDDGDGVFNGRERTTARSSNGNSPDPYIEETSYLKLRELGIYYSFTDVPGGIFERIKVGVSANNLLLWTNYGSYDPEVSNFGSQPVTGNIEVTPYPSSRRLFFHLKLDL